MQFLLALATTRIVEIFAILLLLHFWGSKIALSRSIGIGILATALTIPYLWFIFAAFLDYWTMAVVGECFVFIVEMVIYWKLLPIGLKKAAILSFVANVASILVGLIIGNL